MSVPITSNEIRSAFLTYFLEHGHTIVPSSSLIPANDPTLLFTNAGMVQFKDVFLGTDTRDYKRAASSQKCVRAGGKHNDLERVGYTARHHTFFEMLGNFSFGDYFKKEAIRFSWQFLTGVLKLPKEKLWVTVYKDDQEAEAIWLNELKVDPTRFSRCGEEDNFWSMGPTGPCGPCTEIFYDHGEEVPGGPPGSELADGDRYIEIWNLVFMQYNRDAEGHMHSLPKPSVDTGMGLERITAVMQGVKNNYDTDLFTALIAKTAQLAKFSLQQCEEKLLFSMRVIADHIRSASFLIADGITPSNEGRGYVLRRIIRRAIRHGHLLSLPSPFFYQLVPTLSQIMGEAFPELIEKQAYIEQILRQEEEQFQITLAQGLKHFEEAIVALKTSVMPGQTVFKLYDTYGFPADLTADIARERGLSVDQAGFEAEMLKQRERSRQSSQFTVEYAIGQGEQSHTEFTGYRPATENARVIALYRDAKFVNELKTGEKGSIVLDKTPFYAESGGQIGDQGIIRIDNETYFRVVDTIKQGQTYLHLGKIEKGMIKVGDEIVPEIDWQRRKATVLNHTATHLLHRVLMEEIGKEALQKGSLVEPERLRFDFAFQTPLTHEMIKHVEYKVNRLIRENHHSHVTITTQKEAVAAGAVALFGEKYGQQVRVVQFGPSVELCGGTHAESTGDIGLFKIISETGVASGVRRIEAVTGEAALQYLENRENDLKLKAEQAENRIKFLEKEIAQLKEKAAVQVAQEIASRAKQIGKVNVLATLVQDIDGKALRNTLDQLKTQLGSSVVVLATVKDQRIGLVGGVSTDLTDKFSAKEMITMVASQVGGKGGGRADLAEGGGTQPAHLEKALESVYTWTKIRLENN